MLTGPLCLPATGLDGGSIAIAALLAVAIIAIGIVALRRNKAAAAMVLVPVAVLALAFGGTTTSAQAVTAKIADFTVSETWTFVDPDYLSEVADAAELELFDTLDALVTDPNSLVYTLTLSSEDGLETIAMDPSADADFDASGQVAVDGSAVFAAQALLEDPYGDLLLTYTITAPYIDDCGNPLSTVITWTGTVFFAPPVP